MPHIPDHKGETPSARGLCSCRCSGIHGRSYGRSRRRVTRSPWPPCSYRRIQNQFSPLSQRGDASMRGQGIEGRQNANGRGIRALLPFGRPIPPGLEGDGHPRGPWGRPGATPPWPPILNTTKDTPPWVTCFPKTKSGRFPPVSRPLFPR